MNESLSRRCLAALGVALLLAGCAATPPEPAPVVRVPGAWAHADTQWAAAAAPQADGRWWKAFGDPRLDALEDALEAHNPTLAQQLANYDRAVGLLAQSRAGFFPQVQAGASATRAKAGGSAIVPGAIETTEQLTMNASWIPDLWGKVRLQVQAGEANVAAGAATLQGTLLSLQSTLASTWLQLLTVEAQVKLGELTVEADQRALALTESRLQAGVVTAADVAAARTQLLQAQTGLTDLDVSRAQLRDAVAVLTGVAPADLSSADAAPDVSSGLPDVPRIPAGIPARLLQRRPDLAVDQASVAAANAQVGIDQRAWFPDLTLAGQIGSQGSGLGTLLSAPALFWSIGPQLAATLLDGGMRTAQLATDRAAYRGVVAGYRKDVLAAMQQVEDNLAAQRILAQEARQQDAVVEAAETSLRIAESQYKAGTAPYLNVLTAQTTANAARVGVLTLRARRYAAAVALVQNLGGSWGDAPAPEPARAGAALAQRLH